MSVCSARPGRPVRARLPQLLAAEQRSSARWVGAAVATSGLGIDGLRRRLRRWARYANRWVRAAGDRVVLRARQVVEPVPAAIPLGPARLGAGDAAEVPGEVESRVPALGQPIPSVPAPHGSVEIVVQFALAPLLPPPSLPPPSLPPPSLPPLLLPLLLLPLLLPLLLVAPLLLPLLLLPLPPLLLPLPPPLPPDEHPLAPSAVRDTPVLASRPASAFQTASFIGTTSPIDDCSSRVNSR